MVFLYSENIMTESFEAKLSTEENDIIESIKGELNTLSLSIKKESFVAKQELRDRVKTLWFYNWDENWEDIEFNISNVQKYLESIKNKSWNDLDVKSSELEKWVRTIAIQIAINYINKNDWKSTDKIDWIDGIRGNQTRKWIRAFQTRYNLKNIDGLPWHETITKILELLWNNITWNEQDKDFAKNTPAIENPKTIKNSLKENDTAQNNIGDNKYFNILQNFQIYSKIEWDTWTLNENWNNFVDKFKTKFTDNSKLEWIIFQNPEIQDLLDTIVVHQSQEIDTMQLRYNQKKMANNKDKSQDETDENNSEIISWEDYKFANFSQSSFEEFVLSDEWIAIILDEIKSHINSDYEDENGQYNTFYKGYEFSRINLEVKLKNAWESKMQSNYYAINYDEEKIEEMEKLDVISNQIIWYIDEIVLNYIKSGWKDFDQDVLWTLKWLLSKWINGIDILEMFSDKDYRDTFRWVLSSKIKNYEIFVRNKDNDINLSTLDKQTDLQLKSYLYIYWNIFYSDFFKFNKDSKYYEDMLPEIMKSILSNDDISLINKIKYKELLIAEKKLEQEKKKRDLQRRQEIAKRNREKNENIRVSPKVNEQNNISNIPVESLDPNKSTWIQIAANANLWKELDKYNIDLKKSKQKQQWEKKIIFNDAWKEFIQSYDNIKALITEEQMRNIFDINNNTINDSKRKEFINHSYLLQGLSPKKTEEIYITLSEFSSYFSNVEKKLSKDSSDMSKKVNEAVITNAVGTIIDNVRNTLNTISNKQNNEDWNNNMFELNIEEPVKKDWDNLIISGFFNKSDLKIRYNLESGEIFMNSFLHKLSPNKINIWDNSIIDYPIWSIKSFKDILNEDYNFQSNPPKAMLPQYLTIWPSLDQSYSNPEVQMGKSREQKLQNLLSAQVDLISNNIMENTQKQAAKNNAIIWFMKTFNIIKLSDSWSFNSVDFNKWSNLFDFIKIVENTYEDQNYGTLNLEYFNNTFMPLIMKYSWLKRWENNINQDKENDYSKKLSNSDNSNEDTQYLKNTVENFNPNQFSGIANFEEKHHLKFVDLIKDKLLDESKSKLDIVKMQDFINSLENDGNHGEDPDLELENNLKNI